MGKERKGKLLSGGDRLSGRERRLSGRERR